MQVNYIASPTAARMHASEKFIRGFMGCVGNGKSVACMKEGYRISAEQWPNADGVRLSRGVIVRNTNPELRTTSLKTWQTWFPEEFGVKTRMNPVITSHMRQKLKDGTIIDMEVIFLAMDRDQDVAKLLSLEATWIFLNEARELPFSVLKASRGRAGRFPSNANGYTDVWKDGKLIFDAPKLRAENGDPLTDALGNIRYAPCRRKAILMDTNPPDDDHWWYQLAEEGCLRKAKDKEQARIATSKVFDFFRGPPPLFREDDGTYTENPLAENIANLPLDYYDDQIGGNTEDYIHVMVLGNYGSISEGKLIYSTYNDSTHCPKGGVKPILGLPICLGWDFGGTPACIIGQLTPEGQMRVIDELYSDDLDVYVFARDVVKPHIAENYRHFRIGFSLGDPAGTSRGEGEGKSSIRILNDDYAGNTLGDMVALNMGFKTEEAPTNDPTLRINAVSGYLNKMVFGDPGYVADREKCIILRKGKNGQYCYKRIAVVGQEEKYRSVPDKNRASHTADAEQYLALGFSGGYVMDGSDNWGEEDYDESESHNEDTGY